MPSRKSASPSSPAARSSRTSVPRSAPVEDGEREPLVWVLADDRPGNAAQALGVADALGWPYVEKTVRYTGAAWLPNLLRGAGLAGIHPMTRAALVEPWPDLVIGAGRRCAPLARWLKARTGGRTYLCQVMWPGSAGAADFDLIAVPTHDQLSGLRPNVLRVTGAPHRVTASRLMVEGARWMGRLAHIPKPLLALVVGGTTRQRRFTAAMATDLAGRTRRLAAQMGASVVVTTSRRTGPEATAALRAALPEAALFHAWGESDGENPYFGLLALADAVVVSGDSVSMVSEACATPGPVYLYAPPELTTGKLARLHRHLYGAGLAEPLGAPYTRWTHPPLNAAEDIARRIRLTLGRDVPGGLG